MGDQGVLVTGGFRGLLGPLGTGDVGSGSGDRRAWGRAGGTGPPAVLGGVCGSAGDAVSQEGAIETRGQVCTEPVERGVAGAAPNTHEPTLPPAQAAPSPMLARDRPRRSGCTGCGQQPWGDRRAWPCQGWYLQGSLAASAAAHGLGLPAALRGWRGRSPTGSCSAMAGWGTGPRGWDWCSPGLWHRGDSRCSAEAGRAPWDPLGSAGAITHPARGWGEWEGPAQRQRRTAERGQGGDGVRELLQLQVHLLRGM